MKQIICLKPRLKQINNSILNEEVFSLEELKPLKIVTPVFPWYETEKNAENFIYFRNRFQDNLS